MRSHLLEGIVRHRRVRPFAYALEHDVFYLALDLDELDEVPAPGPLDRPEPAGTCCRSATTDHLDPPAADLRARVLDHLRDEGRDPDGWQVTLVTNLRVIGYVVQSGQLLSVPRPRGRPPGRDRRGPQHARRAAPVQPADGRGRRGLRRFDGQGLLRLAVHRDEPAATRSGSATSRQRLRITINEDPGDGLLLHTSLDLDRRRLTDRMVVRMLIRHPLVTHRTIGMIHWHALRLWLRGARFHRHGEATP